MPTLRVFVSHSSKDSPWCTQFVEALTHLGLDVWFDQKGLYVGDKWVDKLEEELQSRDIFLIVLTPDSWSSEWVKKELRLALALHKRILGVIHKATPVSGFITTYQLLDAVGTTAPQAAAQVGLALGMHPQPAAPAFPVFKNETTFCEIQVRRDGSRSFVEVLEGMYDGPVIYSRSIWPDTACQDRVRAESDAARQLARELEHEGWTKGLFDPDMPFDAGYALQTGIWPYASLERKR